MNSDASDPSKTMKNLRKTKVFHGFLEIRVFTIFPSLEPILVHFFTLFRPQGPHLASLWLLLAPSGAPFGPPCAHFGTPWRLFGDALAPPGANSGHLGPPGHLLERFFTEFHRFLINSGEYSWYFMHLFSHIFLEHLLKLSTVFPILPSISKASMPPVLHAS